MHAQGNGSEVTMNDTLVMNTQVLFEPEKCKTDKNQICPGCQTRDVQLSFGNPPPEDVPCAVVLGQRTEIWVNTGPTLETVAQLCNNSAIPANTTFTHTVAQQ